MEDIATDLITKANAYIAEAEKALKRPTYWGLLRQPSENYDDAADLYKQAANTYKFLKDWPDAYRCYMVAAKYAAGNVEISQLNEISATTRAAVVPIIMQAAEALEHFDRTRAIKLYTTVANLYILLNQYDKAANITAYAALLMRTEGDRQAALTAYQLAAEYYRVSSHNYFKEIECLEMVAKIWIECAAAAAAAMPANTDEMRVCAREAAHTYKAIAAKQFEKIQNISASFRVYQPLFNSVICTFYFDDFVAIKNWYADCCRIMPAFETISDGDFLGKLIHIIELASMEDTRSVEQMRAKYQQICRNREASKPLETWMLDPLLYQLGRITALEENSEEVDLS